MYVKLLNNQIIKNKLINISIYDILHTYLYIERDIIVVIFHFLTKNSIKSLGIKLV